MRVLRVRFRPQLDEAPSIVGHLIWSGPLDREPALLRPAPSSESPGSSDAFLVDLERMVSSTAPDSFARLQRLQDRSWSFVEVAPSELRSPTSTMVGPAMLKSWLHFE